jgi:hypothetical protein
METCRTTTDRLLLPREAMAVALVALISVGAVIVLENLL